MQREGLIAEAAEADDQLGWTMSFIRAAEGVNITRMRRCARAYPALAKFFPADDPNARLHSKMPALREHAYQLAKDAITNELTTLHQSRTDQNSAQYRVDKEHVLTRLKRTLPGTTTSISAIQTDTGHLTTNPAVIANVLKEHWQRCFAGQPIDSTLSTSWLTSLPHLQPQGQATGDCDSAEGLSLPPTDHARTQQQRFARRRGGLNGQHRRRSRLPTEPMEWQIRKCDIQSAIKSSGNSAPGPDGIPFLAWRRLGDLAVCVLCDMASLLETEEAGHLLQDAYYDELTPEGTHSYNMGNLVCLAEKTAGKDEAVGEHYTADGTRHLIYRQLRQQSRCKRSAHTLGGMVPRVGAPASAGGPERPVYCKKPFRRRCDEHGGCT